MRLAPRALTSGARLAGAARTFLADTRAGATAIASAALTVMSVGGAALIVDHLWLVDQRDVLKTAAEAASIAATLDIDRQLAANPRMSDDALKTALEPVAKRYVLVNLAHLSSEQFKKAKDSLELVLTLDRRARTVAVEAKADLGGTLFSRHLPLLDRYAGPEKVAAKAGVETESTPVEVVLAIDISSSMADTLDGAKQPRGSTRSRMAIVKRAAKDLVDILDPNGYNRVAVGIAPWHVNVRLSDPDARKWARERWARYPARRTYPVPYRCHSCTVEKVVDALPDPAPGAWRGCFDGHRMQRVDATTASVVPAATRAALFFGPPRDAPFAQSYFAPGRGTSYRCLSAPELPAGATNSCFENAHHNAQQGCGSHLPALFALSTERAAIERAVDALSARGGLTYSALGVLWAQRMLEPAWKSVWGATGIHPADRTTPEHASLRKAIVLLTDGEDTYCGNGNADCSGSPLAVSRTDACARAKARGTEIFVIAAMNPSKVSEALGRTLRACSSGSDKPYPQGTRRPGTTYAFLNNATPANLAAAFADIAKQLRRLRKVS